MFSNSQAIESARGAMQLYQEKLFAAANAVGSGDVDGALGALVDLKMSHVGYLAALEVMKVADDSLGRLLDLIV
jgi:hypothetical protein